MGNVCLTWLSLKLTNKRHMCDIIRRAIAFALKWHFNRQDGVSSSSIASNFVTVGCWCQLRWERYLSIARGRVSRSHAACDRETRSPLAALPAYKSPLARRHGAFRTARSIETELCPDVEKEERVLERVALNATGRCFVITSRASLSLPSDVWPDEVVSSVSQD